MCGDGTNDVGALRAAHVGVALLPAAAKKKPQTKADNPSSSQEVQEKVRAAPDPADPNFKALVLSDKLNGGQGTKMLMKYINMGVRVENNPRLIDWCARMDQMEADMGSQDVPMVKPGDASMAAPFTARADSVAPVLDILRQGRCTLVTTVQMFKILGQLSLVSAAAAMLGTAFRDGACRYDPQGKPPTASPTARGDPRPRIPLSVDRARIPRAERSRPRGAARAGRPR